MNVENLGKKTIFSFYPLDLILSLCYNNNTMGGILNNCKKRNKDWADSYGYTDYLRFVENQMNGEEN